MRPTILAFLFLLSSSIELTLVLGQFEPCTPGTAPPPVLRPLDSDANYLPMCTPAEDRTQKPATNETTAQQLALCNSFCINRVFSGDFVLNDAAKQTLPGYPTWLLATQSYILSDQGTTTDCLVGSNSNGCQIDCSRFTPPFSFPPLPGGYVLAQDCKDGCMMQFETPSQTVTACGESCRLNCNSVACRCPFFGDGCFGDVAPPCGRDCSSSSCQLGCSDANSHLNNNLTYPAAANPNGPPVITQIGNGTHYLINIADSIPFGLSSDVGYSTLIVRVLDLSSTTTDDYTYFVLENGFEFDLTPFTCRRVNISFAVATDQNGVSDYSPATTLEVNPGSTFPGQLTDFNFTVQQDNRAGFFQHHVIHLDWHPPARVGLATGYTISLQPVSNPGTCSSATFSLADGSLTSFVIQSNISSQPPITGCAYTIQIEVIPREMEEIAQKNISVLLYNIPSSENINISCSSRVNRNKSYFHFDYDGTITLQFDDTFTPPIISRVHGFEAYAFEIYGNSSYKPGSTFDLRVLWPLETNVTQGPVTVDIPFHFLQLTNGRGYRIFVDVYQSFRIPSLRVMCDIFDVTPIPPDQVNNVEITVQEVVPQTDNSGKIDGVLVTLRYMWMPPEFQGEGITGYQTWLEMRPAPNDPGERLYLILSNATSNEIQATFNESSPNFTLYFQIRAISANTHGVWSESITVDVQVTCSEGTYINATITPPAECLPCPTNTNGSQVNTLVCPCLPGYFRTSSEGPETGCTGPPGACQNIKTTFIGERSLTIQWERPAFIGRDDFYYLLEYSEGESTESLQVVNKDQVVSQLITGLKAFTEYTITVTVVNGVSDQDLENEFKRICEIKTTTLEGVPSSPVNVVSYGDVIVWEEPLSTNGVINKYEIQFFILGSELSLTRSRNRCGTFYVVKDEDQLGESRNADTYFQIRAETGAGRGQWSQQLPLSTGSDVTTAPPMTCPPCTCPPCPTAASTCTCGTDTTETPTTCPQPLEATVYFVLKGEILPNNSVIALADVGELENSLFCKTSLTSCCGTRPNRFGQFYYPNGTAVPIKRYQQGFYRNRGDQQIHLHRRTGITSPTGKFRCKIPDSNKVTQILFITLL